MLCFAMSFLVHVDVSILDPFDARMTRSIKALKLGVLFIQNVFEMDRTILSHSETFFCSRHTLCKGAQQFSVTKQNLQEEAYFGNLYHFCAKNAS